MTTGLRSWPDERPVAGQQVPVSPGNTTRQTPANTPQLRDGFTVSEIREVSGWENRIRTRDHHLMSVGFRSIFRGFVELLLDLAGERSGTVCTTRPAERAVFSARIAGLWSVAGLLWSCATRRENTMTTTAAKSTSHNDIKPTDAGKPRPRSTKPRTTKKAQLIQMLNRKSGADVVTISEKFGWLPHTTRAALTGLRKAGLEITTEKPGTGKPLRYRIADNPAVGAA